MHDEEHDGPYDVDGCCTAGDAILGTTTRQITARRQHGRYDFKAATPKAKADGTLCLIQRRSFRYVSAYCLPEAEARRHGINQATVSQDSEAQHGPRGWRSASRGGSRNIAGDRPSYPHRPGLQRRSSELMSNVIESLKEQLAAARGRSPATRKRERIRSLPERDRTASHRRYQQARRREGPRRQSRERVRELVAILQTLKQRGFTTATWDLVEAAIKRVSDLEELIVSKRTNVRALAKEAEAIFLARQGTEGRWTMSDDEVITQ